MYALYFNDELFSVIAEHAHVQFVSALLQIQGKTYGHFTAKETNESTCTKNKNIA